MAPGLTLSAFPLVDVVARVSASGNVAPTAGDFEGVIKGVKTAAQAVPLALVIDRMIGGAEGGTVPRQAQDTIPTP